MLRSGATSRRPSILVVDGDAAVRRYLRRSLVAAGYTVHEGREGANAMNLAAKVPVDAILLDMDLPHPGRLSLIRALQAVSSAPILGLLPAASIARTVAALDEGATDCVAKPFSLGEVLARIRKLLRQRARVETGVIAFSSGGLDVDLAQWEVRLHGKPLALSQRQFDVLRLLVKADGAVVSYQRLLEQVWGPGNDHRVQDLRRTINDLRRKIEPDPHVPVCIVNDMLIGYRLIRNVAPPAAHGWAGGRGPAAG